MQGAGRITKMDELHKILNDKNTPPYIAIILTQLSNAKTRREMYRILDEAVASIPDFRCMDDTVFVGGGFKFQCTLGTYTDHHWDLEAIRRDIPEIETVFSLKIADSDRSVVVTKYHEQ
jgi:hypothetical protein